MVELTPVKREVLGSSPGIGAKLFYSQFLSLRQNGYAAVSKTVTSKIYRGFDSLKGCQLKDMK